MTSVEKKNKSKFDIIEFFYKYLSDFKEEFQGTSKRQIKESLMHALNNCSPDMIEKFAETLNINSKSDWGIAKSQKTLSDEILQKVNVKLDFKEELAVAASSKILVWLLKIMIIQNDEKSDLHQEESNLRTLKVLLYDVILQFGISKVTLLFYKWLKNEHMKRHIKKFVIDVFSQRSGN
jgi:hypothetical protein